MEDSKILLLLNSDPSEGLREAVKKYYAYAAAIARRVLGGREQDVEECVTDAFVSVWRASQESGIRNLKGCIAYAVRNGAINRCKKLRREQSADIDELELPSEEDVVLDFEDTANARLIQNLVYGMDEPDREIFVRKYFLMEPVRAIAGRLGLDDIQVKNRLYRGRQRLKKQLEERGATA